MYRGQRKNPKVIDDDDDITDVTLMVLDGST